MADEEQGNPAVLDMQAVDAQMREMMKAFKAEQSRQMEVYQTQMKAQKELNRFLVDIFIWLDFISSL